MLGEASIKLMVNCEVPKDDASRFCRVSWLFRWQARLLGVRFTPYTDYIQQTLLRRIFTAFPRLTRPNCFGGVSITGQVT